MYGALIPVSNCSAYTREHVHSCDYSRCSRELCRCMQVATYALFAGELYAWFVVGEIVGRGFTLVDYDV